MNSLEQGTLLLGMLRAGIVPRVVLWSNSVHSLREKRIGASLVALYESLPPGDIRGANAILVGDVPSAASAADSLPGTASVPARP